MSIQVILRDTDETQRGCFLAADYEHALSVVTDFVNQHPEQAKTLVVVMYPKKEA